MQTRSQALFPSSSNASAAGSRGVLRAAWQPSLAQQPVRADAAVGHPLRQLLRGLLPWLQRARALNSQAL